MVFNCQIKIRQHLYKYTGTSPIPFLPHLPNIMVTSYSAYTVGAPVMMHNSSAFLGEI